MAVEEKPFPLDVNEARGEVSLWVDDVPLVLAAEMGRLSAVSTRLQCKSLNDLFLRLSDVEAAATVAGIELLTVKGKPLEAIHKLKLKHFGACRIAFMAVLAHHFDGEDEGNAEAASQAA
ncbi:hypothetical protein SAMN03159496_04629 [Rhizobium sp. NFR07]|uniref:hypothetical protein n=1 Tax=Rhizobium sp. NFR07 TaxID=1566262 RepID=UPI0008E17F07|nr:hypothetical protein [Rhizobium sp. NFR07]SFB52269.1 hypothetical protein SAMN03159496_04629 [Rhizobium sp. NFR07]